MDHEDTFPRLICWLDEQEVPYRLIDHAPAGRTEVESPMRGNTLRQAAKYIVLSKSPLPGAYRSRPFDVFSPTASSMS